MSISVERLAKDMSLYFECSPVFVCLRQVLCDEQWHGKRGQAIARTRLEIEEIHSACMQKDCDGTYSTKQARRGEGNGALGTIARR